MNQPEVIRGNNDRIVGHACGKCGTFYSAKGNTDHVERASTCCKPHVCQQCQGESEKWYTKCRNCIRLNRLEAWRLKPWTKWDGSFPVMTWDDDKYIWCEDELAEYLEEHASDELEFEGCSPVVLRSFDVEEFLQDELREDSEIAGAEEFNDTVNAWISENFPKTYIGNGTRITPDVVSSLKSASL